MGSQHKRVYARLRRAMRGNDTEMTAAKLRRNALLGKSAENRLVPQGGTELDRYLRVLIEFFLET